MITRFAPTPSGYLHAGNAVNALLVDWLARMHGGRVALRIDDVDAARARPAYLDDIFDTLTWLGVRWQLGPRDRWDFEAHHSQTERTERYREALGRARANGLQTYACTCTRSTMRGVVPTGGCPGGCLNAGHALETGATSLRVHVPPDTVVDVGGVGGIGGTVIDVAARLGDFVVWRRDGLPAYQLVSVVEDELLGVTHVVRGDDLRESTAAQLHLASFLDAPAVLGASYVHHGLLLDDSGSKLSKSQLGQGEPLPRDDLSRSLIRRRAEDLARPLGIIPPAQ